MAKGYKQKAPGSGGGGGGMMGQLQKLQEQLAQAQSQLAEETVTHTAGGGAIQITVTGDQHITAIKLDAEMLKDLAGDAEMFQDMLLAAINGALEASRKLAEQRLGPLAGGLPF